MIFLPFSTALAFSREGGRVVSGGGVYVNLEGGGDSSGGRWGIEN